MSDKIRYAFCLETWRYETDFESAFDSVEDALKAAEKHYNQGIPIGAKVFVGKYAKAPTPSIDVERIFDDIGCQYYDEYGEAADDYLQYVKQEHEEILSNELNKVFSKWLKKYNYLPTFFTVYDDKAYVYDGEKWNEQ